MAGPIANRTPLCCPGKTSPEIVNRIHEAISHVLNSAEVRKTIAARSLVVADLGPKAFAEQIARESRSRSEAVRRFGAKTD